MRARVCMQQARETDARLFDLMIAMYTCTHERSHIHTRLSCQLLQQATCQSLSLFLSFAHQPLFECKTVSLPRFSLSLVLLILF